MAANHPLCNIFSQVIAATFGVATGEMSAEKAITALTERHVDDFVTSDVFDAIQTALMNIECRVQQEEDVRMVVKHSVMGVTPTGRRVCTPTSEAAFTNLLKMGFESHSEGIVYDGSSSVPTIIEHLTVMVDTVIPGPDSFDC